jgi:hypothetical protein
MLLLSPSTKKVHHHREELSGGDDGDDDDDDGRIDSASQTKPVANEWYVSDLKPARWWLLISDLVVIYLNLSFGYEISLTSDS